MKIYKQETNKSCGVACVRSILNYYGNNFSEKDLWDKNDYFGTKENIINPILSLGVLALKFGFEVKYIGYNPIIANGNHEENLEKSLKEKSKNNFSFGKYYVDEALKFLKLKGTIKIDKLNVKKLKKIIDDNNFALVEIKPSFINHEASLSMNHKVIVIGYNKKGFKILNPSDAKEHLWDFDTFLLAFYAAVPELLIIKKKKI